jgi:hypothetical protein
MNKVSKERERERRRRRRDPVGRDAAGRSRCLNCNTLSARYYSAQIDGNSVWMFGHDLWGKEHKIKYHYVGGW